MTEPVFEIRTPGINTEEIVAAIQRTVDEKMAAGIYDDARIARAERLNLNHLRDEEQFLGFYMRCLRDAVYVNISDFEIHERRRSLAFFLVAFKKTIWKLLKFYTYRLWSQQNEINGLLVTAVEALDEKYAARLAGLEKRVAELEEQEAGARSEA